MTFLFKKVLAHFLFQVLCLGGISFVSKYRVPDLSDIRWDSALFITPLGILKNFMEPSPVMRSFYADISKGQIELGHGQIALIALLLMIQITNFTLLIKTLNK